MEDRIRDGIAGSLNEQIAIGLQVGRALAGWHEKKRFLEHLSSSAVTIDADNNVTLFGPESNDTSLRYGNARAFGVILFELFSGRLMADHEEAEPDVELLHKAGLPPALVEVVSECVEDPGQGRVIEKSTRKLKEILRERLGERASTPKTLPIVGAALGLLALGCAAWLLLR